MNGKEAAAKLKERNRKMITLPNSGAEFVICKINPYDFTSQIEVDIPGGVEFVKDERPRVKLDKKQQKKFMDLMIEKGCLEPRVVCGDANADDDEIHISDLGDDYNFLCNEIMLFSGLIDEVDVKRNFRSEEEEERVDD